MFTLCRIAFYFSNSEYFTDINIGAFWGGIRFDLTAIVMFNLPLIVLYLIPIPIREHRIYQLALKIIFFLINGFAIGLNLMDLEYFKFTSKRSTIDLLDLAGAGDDLKQLIPVFLRDYWYIILLFILMIWGMFFLYKKTEKSIQGSIVSLKYVAIHLLVFVVAGGLSIIGVRGGLQPKTLTIIDASGYTSSGNVPVVLNTPFTMISSLNQQQLEEKEFFTDEEVQKWFNPVKQYDRSIAEVGQPNIVLIMLESFSAEYLGGYNDGDGYTPFLDSLMQQSLVFDNAFANGKKSIEGVPACVAGMYTLMNSPYTTSVYSTNDVNSLASVLGEIGYHTAFYHGATNGSMRFDAFCNTIGFNEYYGRYEYDNDDHFDGQWGIWDEEMLQFYATQMSTHKQPFFTTCFTMTSHHPFAIPERYEGRFKGSDELAILRTIEYTDYALQRFFNTAKHQPWFENTLFIITADHVGPPRTSWSHNPVGKYAIPMIMYKPDGSFAGRDSTIVQQADILPSVLDYLNYEEKFVAFGESVFRPDAEHMAVSYLNNIYQIIIGDYLFQWDGEKTISLHNYREDYYLRTNLLNKHVRIRSGLERKIKAIVQTYNNRMIRNELTPNE